LKERYAADVELIRSRGGAFEVSLDGRLLYSKLAEGRFPTHDEIDALIAGG
jgi:selT/selW/selH-like putative selenoprotein